MSAEPSWETAAQRLNLAPEVITVLQQRAVDLAQCFDLSVEEAASRVLQALAPRELPDRTRGMSVDDLIDNIDELLASRTPESTEGDT